MNCIFMYYDVTNKIYYYRICVWLCNMRGISRDDSSLFIRSRRNLPTFPCLTQSIFQIQMSEHQGFRISWSGEKSSTELFANMIHITEGICTPFSIRQFHLLGLLPPVDSHPRVLDNASGSGRQAEASLSSVCRCRQGN